MADPRANLVNRGILMANGGDLNNGNVAALLQQINGLRLHCRHWV
jgi:hypothetical protein